MEPHLRRLISNRIRGRRFQFAGSASNSCKIENLECAHAIVRRLTGLVISNGGGLVATLGEDPIHGTGNLSTIFDWTVSDTFARMHSGGRKWPYEPSSQLVEIGFANWRSRIPTRRRSAWRQIVATKR